MPSISSLLAVTLLSSGLAGPSAKSPPLDAAPANTQLARGGHDAERIEEDDADDASVWAPLSYYTSFGLDDDLHPEVEDEVLVMWIMAAVLPLGEFYLPYVFGDPGDGYFGDMLTSYAVHGYGYMPTAIGAFLPLLPVAWLWAVIYSGVAKFYLNPVSMINLYSRSLYRQEQNLPHPLVEGGLPAVHRSLEPRDDRRDDISAPTPVPAEDSAPALTPATRPPEDTRPPAAPEPAQPTPAQPTPSPAQPLLY